MIPKVSIVIPAYNTEKFIGKCIDSILCQTYSAFELIVVDDGSRDRTPEILDRYAASDSRIVVVHQSNRGVQEARNTAVRIATGEYLCFVDSDDTLSSVRSLQLLVDRMVEDNLVLAVGWFNMDWGKRKRTRHGELFTTVDAKNYLTEMLTGKQNWTLCGKLFRTDCFRKLPEHGLTVAAAEDALYNILYCSSVDGRVGMVCQPVYNYFMRPESVVHTVNPKYIYDNMAVGEFVASYLSDQSAPYAAAFRLLCFSGSFRYGWLGSKHPVYAPTIDLYRLDTVAVSLLPRNKRARLWLLLHFGDFLSKFYFRNFIHE